VFYKTLKIAALTFLCFGNLYSTDANETTHSAATKSAFTRDGFIVSEDSVTDFNLNINPEDLIGFLLEKGPLWNISSKDQNNFMYSHLGFSEHAKSFMKLFFVRYNQNGIDIPTPDVEPFIKNIVCGVFQFLEHGIYSVRFLLVSDLHTFKSTEQPMKKEGHWHQDIFPGTQEHPGLKDSNNVFKEKKDYDILFFCVLVNKNFGNPQIMIGKSTDELPIKVYSDDVEEIQILKGLGGSGYLIRQNLEDRFGRRIFHRPAHIQKFNNGMRMKFILRINHIPDDRQNEVENYLSQFATKEK